MKFSHTIFAMPFAMIGLVLGYSFHYQFVPESTIQFFIIKLFLVLLCMVSARNAAMAFNRYIDRKYDEQNPRTAIREIPSGIIPPKNALIFVLVNCFLFVGAAYSINKLCFFLSPIALVVILGYSLTKRFTFLCHLVLGLGLALAPIGAFLAVTGVFSLLPLFFSFAVLCWVSGFDIIYALQDEQFDKANQLYSIPSYFGQQNAKWIARFLHLLSAAFIITAGVSGGFHALFWVGVVCFCILLIYQHALVIRYGLEKIDMAFFTTNGIASVVFASFVIADILIL